MWTTRLTAIAILMATTAFSVDARTPLKRVDAGETALDQRVLMRPGAMLFTAPDGAGVEKPPVFSSYYVFDTVQSGDKAWLEVGPRHDGGETAWVATHDTVDWKQTITLAFSNPAERLPVMFFEDADKLKTFLADPQMSTKAELLNAGIETGNGMGDSGIIAREPENYVSITDQFYLLPILDFQKVAINRRSRKVLEVASINLDQPQPPSEERPFRTGIVFVIDTSVSMQPYIDQTKTAVATILEQLRGSGQDDNFSFGVIGFRGDARAVPGLEYTAKEFFPLKKDFDEAGFMAALDQMTAATVSSTHFSEDGLSGLVKAASSADWQDFDGRFMIYVSDAGMLVGKKEGSQSATTPELLAERLRKDQQIATFAMLLQTKAGTNGHDAAKAQLDKLTYQETAGRSLTFPIENGDVGAFGDSVKSLTDTLLAQVDAGRQQGDTDECETDPDAIRCAAQKVGYAMKLSWLGRQEQTQAPSTYTSWVPDFALDDPARQALSPRVLLTKGQLNDLYVTLQAILDAAQQSEQVEPEKFFSVLRTTLGRMMRDPSQLTALDGAGTGTVPQITDFDDLGDLVSDYLVGLPYESDLASETPEAWIARGPTGRYEFIQNLQGKLQMYELYYADTPNWIALNPKGGESDKVYPIPLEMMP